MLLFENSNRQPAEMKMDIIGNNVSPNSNKINKRNKIDWKFNFHYNYENRPSTIHGIEIHGKTMKCDHSSWLGVYCLCFSTMSNNGMKPNSGIYDIRIKINKIKNASAWNNIIGITSEQYDKKSLNQLRKNKNYDWTNDSNNYIGWSACGTKDDKQLPNGLYCGEGHNGRKNNIFRKNNFIYQSKNGNYKSRLPGFRSGDILLLSYNSNLNELSFGKEFDNGKLNSFIKNLPKNRTFYWFVAHFDDNPMSISICS